MRTWLLPAGMGIALGLVGAVIILVVSAGDPTAAERADALAAELRCPDCQGLSVADSPTRSAREMRRQIDELVAGGATDDAVRAHFTARYGEWIRLAPSAPWSWALPFAVVLLGVAGLVAWVRAAAGRPAPAAPAQALPDDERRRLHRDAEALDG